MDSRLLIPLPDLPGRAPNGSPVVYENDALPHITGHGALCPPLPGDGDYEMLVPWFAFLSGFDAAQAALADLAPGCGVTGGAGYRLDPRYLLLLDLSPPPLDTQGWPTRVDGADVAAGMLARAHGATGSALWFWHRAMRCWVLRASGLPTHDGAMTFGAGPGLDVSLPALAEVAIDTGPLADRLALAAVLRAKPWGARHAR